MLKYEVMDGKVRVEGYEVSQVKCREGLNETGECLSRAVILERNNEKEVRCIGKDMTLNKVADIKGPYAEVYGFKIGESELLCVDSGYMSGVSRTNIFKIYELLEDGDYIELGGDEIESIVPYEVYNLCDYNGSVSKRKGIMYTKDRDVSDDVDDWCTGGMYTYTSNLSVHTTGKVRLHINSFRRLMKMVQAEVLNMDARDRFDMMLSCYGDAYTNVFVDSKISRRGIKVIVRKVASWNVRSKEHAFEYCFTIIVPISLLGGQKMTRVYNLYAVQELVEDFDDKYKKSKYVCEDSEIKVIKEAERWIRQSEWMSDYEDDVADIVVNDDRNTVTIKMKSGREYEIGNEV